MSVALTASQPALEACQRRPRPQRRQFGTGHDVRAAALSALDRKLQAEADEIKGCANVDISRR